jgi:hypothetical protein
MGRDIDVLKRLYAKCSLESHPGKKRFAFYEYLYQVYAMHAHWRAQARVRGVKRHIADLVQVGSKPNQQVLKLMIDASCAADHKTRSRWGQALRYVWRRRKRKRVSRVDFRDFLHCNGGVVGCAAKSAIPKMKSVEGRLGCGFDSLAFQKSIDSQKSDVTVILAPHINCLVFEPDSCWDNRVMCDDAKPHLSPRAHRAALAALSR